MGKCQGVAQGQTDRPERNEHDKHGNPGVAKAAQCIDHRHLDNIRNLENRREKEQTNGYIEDIGIIGIKSGDDVAAK
jgi:hypothetical protein